MDIVDNIRKRFKCNCFYIQFLFRNAAHGVLRTHTSSDTRNLPLRLTRSRLFSVVSS